MSDREIEREIEEDDEETGLTRGDFRMRRFLWNDDDIVITKRGSGVRDDAPRDTIAGVTGEDQSGSTTKVLRIRPER